MKTRLAKTLCGVVLLLGMGCSTAKKIGSLGIPNLIERISVQRAPAAGVSIRRIKENNKYDFYISLLDESGEPSRTYIVKGFREQAKAQFYRDLNSVIINDEGEALYALVVDKDIEYRFRLDDVK
ncbi:hypothetical protein MYX82_06485 [Acidobacteria bacterium AH-259-D05]|nr:hypothetical protein [Acidobacteria bacterium AH-259-D05]